MLQVPVAFESVQRKRRYQKVSLIIADEILKTPGFNRKKRTPVESAIARSLRRGGPRLLNAWFLNVEKKVERFIDEAERTSLEELRRSG
jgi:hypothetical protein